MVNQELEAKKEYLKGYEKARRQLRRSEERIRELRSSQLGAAIKLDGMPHAHNSTDLSSYAAALDVEESRHLAVLNTSMERYQKIMETIEQLVNEDEKDVLTFRYINLLKWEEICEEVGKSWKQTHRIHLRGLRNIKIDSESWQQT